jgi:hypothetical protein
VGQRGWLRKPFDKPEEWLEDTVTNLEELKVKNEWHTTTEWASVVQGAQGARFLTAVLVKIHVFWGVTPCILVKSDVSMEQSIFTFGVKQSKLYS